MGRETSRASDGEKTMESFVDGICNLIGFYLVLGSMLGLYMAPLIIATVRDHHRLPWIGLLNFAAGWTVVGWIAALVWSVTAIPQPAAITRIGSTALRTAQLVAA
jgi:hypothetical protein